MPVTDHTCFIRFDVAGDPVGKLCRSMTEAGLGGSLSVGNTSNGETVFHVPDIERRAKLTVRENDKRGPHYAKWQPFPVRQEVEAAE